jgi:hypothetical protein
MDNNNPLVIYAAM